MYVQLQETFQKRFGMVCSSGHVDYAAFPLSDNLILHEIKIDIHVV